MPGNLEEILQELENSNGLDFEESVVNALEFLDFGASRIQGNEGDSDVIAEATYAENPYYVVIECCAVEPHNQVPYAKLGQIRGNFTKYMDERRQKIFKNAYKLIVGRPEFSNPAKTNSAPDVGLMKVSILKNLLESNAKYHFSQDQLEKIFSVYGEITEEHLNTNLIEPFKRKLMIYSLIFLSLLENPFTPRNDIRKPFTPVEQIIGEVKAYANLFKVSALSSEEITSAIRDLCSPLPSLIDIKENHVRLSSHPIEMLDTLGGLWVDLRQKFQQNVETFRQLQRRAI